MASRSGAADGGHHRLTASVRRHPADPDPVRATKARAVWWLGLTAAVTGPLLGGVVPAAVALILAGQFRREAYAAGGFLTGAALVRRGERLAWAGIVLAALAVVVAVMAAVLHAAGAPGARFPSHVD
ncbi:MAG: hypothetical protein FWJ70_13370 [Micromonosporaceae bacterium]